MSPIRAFSASIMATTSGMSTLIASVEMVVMLEGVIKKSICESCTRYSHRKSNNYTKVSLWVIITLHFVEDEEDNDCRCHTSNKLLSYFITYCHSHDIQIPK